MRALIGLGLAAMLLASCGETANEPAEAPAAAPLPPGRPAIYEAAIEGPEPFARAVYAAYAAGAVEALPPRAMP